MIWLYEAFFPAVWITFLIFWQIKAFHTKKTERLEPAGSRILRVLIIAASLAACTLALLAGSAPQRLWSSVRRLGA